MYRLVMRQGPTPNQVFELSKNEMVVGREISNDIVINDAEVSRRHARLVLDAGRYVLEDFGSTNGTFVNGQRLMGPHALSIGEVIKFGENVTLSFESAQYDPDATVVGGQDVIPAAPAAYPPAPAAYPAAPPPAYAPAQPAPAYAPPLAPAYVGQVPAGPVMYETPEPVEPPKKRGTGTWIAAGCGCLVLVGLCLAAVLFVIDYLNLWCSIFGSLIPGC
jgi:predicted component of type VI protein secretion system